jgi:hypothetical protein
MARIHRLALHGEHASTHTSTSRSGPRALVVKAALLDADEVIRGVAFRVLV